MAKSRLALLNHILRAVLIGALILFMPLTGHHMAGAMGNQMGSQMTGHHMTMTKTSDKMDDALSCQVLCLGWVQTAQMQPPPAPVMTLIGDLLQGHFTMAQGLDPAPIRHPPRPAPTL